MFAVMLSGIYLVVVVNPPCTIYTINNIYNILYICTEHVDIAEHQRHIQEVTVPSEG